MAQPIDLETIEKLTKQTIANLNEMKKRGKTEKTISIDGLLQYSEIVMELYKQIKELNKTIEKRDKTIEKRDKTIESLKAHIETYRQELEIA